jgi:hypothetical protein
MGSVVTHCQSVDKGMCSDFEEDESFNSPEWLGDLMFPHHTESHARRLFPNGYSGEDERHKVKLIFLD